MHWSISGATIPACVIPAIMISRRNICRAEPAACCDLGPKRAEERAAEFGIRAYSDAAEMLKAEKPDLVHVVTPPSARVEPLTLVSDIRLSPSAIPNAMA